MIHKISIKKRITRIKYQRLKTQRDENPEFKKHRRNF
jgi:hypothetical protein